MPKLADVFSYEPRIFSYIKMLSVFNKWMIYIHLDLSVRMEPPFPLTIIIWSIMLKVLWISIFFSESIVCNKDLKSYSFVQFQVVLYKYCLKLFHDLRRCLMLSIMKESNLQILEITINTLLSNAQRWSHKKNGRDDKSNS